jgi:bacteriorhodopsin
MTNVSESGDRATKWIRWIARIWSFPIILYALLMFAGYAWNLVTIGKADPYSVEGYPPIEALPPILMFISILGLGISWRWEGFGGTFSLVFISIVLILLLIQRPPTQDFYRSAIPYLLSMVVAIPGFLFLVCWWRSRMSPT